MTAFPLPQAAPTWLRRLELSWETLSITGVRINAADLASMRDHHNRTIVRIDRGIFVACMVCVISIILCVMMTIILSGAIESCAAHCPHVPPGPTCMHPLQSIHSITAWTLKKDRDLP
jgi:hypothetical protein